MYNRRDAEVHLLSGYYVFVSDKPFPAGDSDPAAIAKSNGVWSRLEKKQAGYPTKIPTVIELTLDGPAVEITPKDVVDIARGKSLAAGKPVRASNVYGNMVDAHGPQKLVDGDHSTRWAAHESDQPVWVEIDLGKPTKIGKVCIDERDWNRVKRFVLQVATDDGWRNVVKGTTIGADFEANLKPVTTRRVRLQIIEAPEGATILAASGCPVHL